MNAESVKFDSQERCHTKQISKPNSLAQKQGQRAADDDAISMNSKVFAYKPAHDLKRYALHSKETRKSA